MAGRLKKKPKRLMIALGGNALGDSPAEQLERVKATAQVLTDLAADGIQLIITHGNGPQVGVINAALEAAHGQGIAPRFPFAECGAMTQGYIGYHLQQALANCFAQRGIAQIPVCVVTQVRVDPKDPAFADPTKPIGRFMTEEEAKRLAAQTGYTVKEDAGRGWRRVVPSPVPVDVVEFQALRRLLENGCAVIASGGGGIPVIRTAEGYRGVDAVIDKDRSAALMATELGADMLVILTAVDKVCLNYGKPDQVTLDRLSTREAERYIREGHFAKGSMLPKIEACLSFLRVRSDATAVIAALDNVRNAVYADGGTKLYYEPSYRGQLQQN